MFSALRRKKSQVVKKSSSESSTAPVIENFLSSLNVVIIVNVLGKPRSELFNKKISQYGGTAVLWEQSDEPATIDTFKNSSHIICDRTLSPQSAKEFLFNAPTKKVQSSQNELPELVAPLVSSKWLSACLEKKSLLPHDEFIIKSSKTSISPAVEVASATAGPSTTTSPEKLQADTTDEEPSPKKHKQKSYVSSITVDDSFEFTDCVPVEEAPCTSTMDRKKESFICMKSSQAPKKETVNQKIVDKLKEMAEAYKSTKDKWRAFGYEKAIFALKSAKEPICSYEAAIALPGVGKRLAEKIWEIAEHGSFAKLEMMQGDESVAARKLFTRIWGVGPETANQWAEQGLRTLVDVKEKAKLNHNQKIGLQHFHDFDERMPRDEVARIEAVVKKAALELNPDLWVTTCGSYRRGKPTCGDVDILITHPNGHSHAGIFQRVLDKLHDQEFLTDDLTVQANMTGGMAKYLGVCKLPEPNSKYRRLDIMVTPFSEYGCALLYFTGSAHFNRSMRLMADKMGLSLTEHALYKDVVRNDKVKVHKGVRVPTPNEQSIFTYLGIPYRPPEERDHS